MIDEALAGKVPSYLERLELDTTSDELGAGDEVRGWLRGDLHLHTKWSDGGAEIAAMARTAMELGHEYLAITDHSPQLTIARGLEPERLREQLDVIDALNAELAPFRILTGIEVDILDDGALDQEDELLARLDVVVASVHSKLRMEERADDRADDHRDREPAHGHPRPLHRPADQGPRPAREHVRLGARVRRVPRARQGGRGELPPRAARPAPPACSRWSTTWA